MYELAALAEVLEDCEKVERDWVEKMKEQIRGNILAGKPLCFEWLREKKFKGKRLFFVVNTEKKKALLIAFGPKHAQQRIINYIIKHKEYYFSLLNGLS